MVASLASGSWSRTSESAGSSNQQIALHDTVLLDEIAVDVEIAGKGAIIVQRVSTWRTEQELKVLIREMVKLTSLGRYTSLYVAICIDTEISPAMAKNIAIFQSTSFGSSQCIASFQMVTEQSLAVAVANRILQARAQFGDELESSLLTSLNACQGQALFILRIVSSITATETIQRFRKAEDGSLRTLQQVVAQDSSDGQSVALTQLRLAVMAPLNQENESAWDL